jgi:hypothetical protein
VAIMPALSANVKNVRISMTSAYKNGWEQLMKELLDADNHTELSKA